MSELFKVISKRDLQNSENLSYAFSLLRRNKTDVLKILLITFIYSILAIAIVLYFNTNDILYIDYTFENTSSISYTFWLFVITLSLVTVLLRYIDKIYQNEIGVKISLKKYPFYFFKNLKYLIINIFFAFCIKFALSLMIMLIGFILSFLGGIGIILLIVFTIAIIFLQIIMMTYLYILFFEYVVVQKNLSDSTSSLIYLGFKKMCKIGLITILNSIIIGIVFMVVMFILIALVSLLVDNEYLRAFITFPIIGVFAVVTNILIFTTIFVKYMNYTYLELGEKQMIKEYKFNIEDFEENVQEVDLNDTLL